METNQNDGGTPGKTMEQWLREALLADPATPEGKTLRASVSAMHMEEARMLVLRSAAVSDGEQPALRDAARRTLAAALMAERLHLETAPRATASSECLLDPPPDAPTDVIAQAALLGAKVQWAEPNAYGEKVSYALGISPKPPLLAAVTVSGAQAQVTGLAAGTVYTFTVTATNTDGTGPVSLFSNTVKVGAAPPTAPTAVTAAEQGAGVALSWTAGAGGGALTAQVVRAYDPARPAVVLFEQKLDGAARQAVFAALTKGSYVFGVRPYSEGGFGPEVRSATVNHAPTPTVVNAGPYQRPPLPTPDSLMLFDLGDAATQVLDPTALRRRMTPIAEKASQWRFDHLKALALNAAKETVGYDQLLAQMMQMTVGKVVGAQAALNSVLPAIITGVEGAISTVEHLADSDLVQGIVKKVGDAAASLLALEGLIHFLIDQQPLAFWTGLFDGLISDIAHFDRDLTDTNKFLYAYFDGAGSELIKTVKGLTDRIDSTVHDVLDPLRGSVATLTADVDKGLRAILNELEETVVSATVLVPGADGAQVKQFLGNGAGLTLVSDLVAQIGGAIDVLEKQLRGLLDAALQDPADLLVSLIKDFIVYPILGIMVVSFAGGPIAAGIIGAIVCAAGIELIRVVARWLSGPLGGVLNDAEQALLDTVHELQGVLQKVENLVPQPLAQLKLAAANLAGLAHLLPQRFLQDVALLVGDARRALLSQASELALTAERALGLENATAFDILQPGYESNLPKAPDLPGGADSTLFAGMALIRDFSLLEHARTQLLNPKETVVTLRLSLFKLLGGSGSPANFAGDAATLFQTFLKGGPLLLNLDEQTLIEQGFPGLYRALIVDMKPIGLLGAASSALPILPSGIPLSITHLGASRIRVKRDANPAAPPVLLPEALRLGTDQLMRQLAADTDPKTKVGGNTGPLLLAAVEDIVAALVPDDFNPTKVDFIYNRPQEHADPTVLYRDDLQARLLSLSHQVLTGRLINLLDPVVSAADVSKLVAYWMDASNTAGYHYFGLPGPMGNTTTNDDAGRKTLRAIFRQEMLAQLDSAERKEAANTTYGLPTGGARALREQLSPAIDAGRARELPEWSARIAKWGGARFDRERDPQIESLGFATLVQDFPAESAAFNLLADIGSGISGALGSVAGGFVVANPARGAEPVTQSSQYRSFENRGVEGEWLLNLESALNPGTLLDLLLEVTVRGCYDDSLAAAVKASRQQSKSAFARAQAVASSVNKTLRAPGSLPFWDKGSSGVKTIHYSLRGHRENLLKNVLAAADAIGNSTSAIDQLSLDRNKKQPLDLLAPLSGIAMEPLNQFTLQFQSDQSGTPLGVLHKLLAVTPADFGLSSADALSRGQLVGLSFVVIPSGKATADGSRATLLNNISFDKALLPLLPQFDPTSTEYQGPPGTTPPLPAAPTASVPPPPPPPPPQKLLYMARTTNNSVTLDQLFGQPQPTGITLDFGQALDEGHIYDVIFSLSVRTPVPQLTVSPSAVAI